MPYNDEMEGGKREDKEEEEQSRRERALVYENADEKRNIARDSIWKISLRRVCFPRSLSETTLGENCERLMSGKWDDVSDTFFSQ